MRILFLGDISGRSGREAIVQKLPELKEKYQPDFVIVNAENAAGGFGVTEQIINDLSSVGVDCMTSGNHIWDQKETISFIERSKKLLRPINYPKGTPGKGAEIYETRSGKKIMVINAMGRLFMETLDCPFQRVDEVLSTYALKRQVDAIFVDFHAEATSEKMIFANYVDGRVSAVIGTHTHIPTSDLHILTKGTAYQSDAGMCGDYDSIIGMQKAVPIQKMTKKLPTPRMEAALGVATICGSLIDIDDKTGLATQVHQLIIGPHLKQQLPPI